MFCVNALRPTEGRPSFVAGGADGRVRVIEVRVASSGSSSSSDPSEGGGGEGGGEGSGGEGSDGGYGKWLRSKVAPFLASSTDSYAKGLGSEGALPNGCELHPVHTFDAHDGGMLGMACEDKGERSPLGPMLVTCAFSGHAALWRLNSRELDRLQELPARRLKALLRARGVPIEGLFEKSDFIRLIKRFGALPVATKVADFEPHGGTVVSSSFFTHTEAGECCGVAATSSHDGRVKIFRLDEALERERAKLEGSSAGSQGGGGGGGGGGGERGFAPLVPHRIIDAHPGAGCDIAVLERSNVGGGSGAPGTGSSSSSSYPALCSVLTGGKDGYVRSWDFETGKCTFESHLGGVWVWCLRSRGALEGGLEEGPPGGGGAYANGACFLSGCTAGIVRLFDRRVGARAVQAVSVEEGPLASDYVAGGMHLGEGRAIAGLSL